jgi:alpha-L-fucosidase 2
MLPVGRSGRYVRIQLADTNYLSLAEVKVFAPATIPLGDNVALGKAASQSSTWGPDIAVAGRAVDGNTSGDWWADESIASTKLQTHPWWQVDLGEVYSEITGIEIWNRTDSVPERLDDFYVFVSDVPFVSGDLAATLAQSGVWSYHHVGVPDPKVMLPVGRSGRYVRIQLADTNYLSLAEVKVFATA